MIHPFLRCTKTERVEFPNPVRFEEKRERKRKMQTRTRKSTGDLVEPFDTVALSWFLRKLWLSWLTEFGKRCILDPFSDSDTKPCRIVEGFSRFHNFLSISVKRDHWRWIGGNYCNTALVLACTFSPPCLFFLLPNFSPFFFFFSLQIKPILC